MCEDILGRSGLHKAAKIHDTDRIGDVLYDGEVMRDEEIRQIPLLLQGLQQVDDLCLHGYVQRRYRLVADYKLRIQGQCTRDADTLTLSAGELMRVAILVIALQSAVIHNLCNIILILVFRYQIVLLYCLADGTGRRERLW